VSASARFGWILCASVIVLAGVGIAYLCLGTVWVSPNTVFGIIHDHRVPGDAEALSPLDAIVWNIRMPRLLVAAMAGFALGVAGTVLQGMFRNPIADPQLVGLSSFAAVGALAGFWFGYATGGHEVAVAAGAAAGLIGALGVRWIANRSGSDLGRFILVGIGVGLAVGAIVATASIAIHEPRIPDVTFLFFGGLSTATLSIASWVAIATVVSVVGVLPFARRLDILSLGNDPARHVGVNVTSVVIIATAFVGLGVGASVGAIGVVAFVGLVAGRVAFELVGPHHRFTIPMSGVTGAVFVVTADLLGRLIGHGFEVPVGLITTVLGGAFLVSLILRNKVVT
jgi:iron complex transport system permease protein